MGRHLDRGMRARHVERSGGKVTNNQCEAYAVLAMRQAGIDEKKIKEVLADMRYFFDTRSEESVCMQVWGTER